MSSDRRLQWGGDGGHGEKYMREYFEDKMSNLGDRLGGLGRVSFKDDPSILPDAIEQMSITDEWNTRYHHFAQKIS